MPFYIGWKVTGGLWLFENSRWNSHVVTCLGWGFGEIHESFEKTGFLPKFFLSNLGCVKETILSLKNRFPFLQPAFIFHFYRSSPNFPTWKTRFPSTDLHPKEQPILIPGLEKYSRTLLLHAVMHWCIKIDPKRQQHHQEQSHTLRVTKDQRAPGWLGMDVRYQQVFQTVDGKFEVFQLHDSWSLRWERVPWLRGSKGLIHSMNSTSLACHSFFEFLQHKDLLIWASPGPVYVSPLLVAQVDAGARS